MANAEESCHRGEPKKTAEKKTTEKASRWL